MKSAISLGLMWLAASFPFSFWSAQQAGDFYFDDFSGTTGTVLTSHTANIGGAYTATPFQVAPTTDAVLTGTGGLKGPVITGSPGDGVGYILASSSPPSADYAVTMVVNNIVDNAGYGPAARTNSAATQGYILLYGGAGLGLYIYGFVSSSFIASAPSYVMPTGTHTMTLKVSGTTITGYVDEVQQIQVTDSSSSAAGSPMLFLACDDTTGGTGDYTVLEAYAHP